jgi:UDP-glucose 4-epimerase
MRLLVTGGCGFVGVNLIDFLRRESKCDIVVLDNLTLGRREYLAPYEVKFVEGDIRDVAVVNEAMRGISSVIHLAADTRVIDSIQNPLINFEVNVSGTFNLLQAAKKAGVEAFVFASTGGAIVGHAVPPVHEQMPPRPISPYGASKLAGEGYLSAFSGSYGMKTTALRFSNVYGPRSYHKGSVVAQFYKNILEGKEISVFGDGEQTRDFVYVDDICRAILANVAAKTGGGVYQLGSGMATSVNHLLQLIGEAIYPMPMPRIVHLPARAGEVLHTFSKINLAEEKLGFSPRMPLREGLRITWEWFQARQKSQA